MNEQASYERKSLTSKGWLSGNSVGIVRADTPLKAIKISQWWEASKDHSLEYALLCKEDLSDFRGMLYYGSPIFDFM